MRRRPIKKFIRGDTIIEVTFAIVIFSAVAVSAIALMNSGANNAQASLEISMARSEINAQAEALRFIHNAFTLERNLGDPAEQEYVNLWLSIAELADANRPDSVNGSQLGEYPPDACKGEWNPGDIYGWANPNSIFNDGAFIINVRRISPIPRSVAGGFDRAHEVIILSRTRGTDLSAAIAVNDRLFREAPLYPRIIYTWGAAEDDASTGSLGDDQSEYLDIGLIEGIWIVPVASERINTALRESEFFDFHIRTCWYAPGKLAPSTISTTIRLYNPQYFEEQNV